MAEPMMGTAFPTLIDFKQQYGPGENPVADVCEILYKSNPMFEHIPWRAGNELTGHRFFVRTELPFAHTREVNQGIMRSNSKISTDSETTEEFVTSYHADAHAMNELFQGSAHANAYLASEEKPHIYALGDAVLNAMLYGSNPKGVRGFMYRLSDLEGAYKDQIIDASELIEPTDNPRFRSVLAVKWDPSEVSGIHNKHGSLGMTVERFDTQVYDRDKNGTFTAYVVNMHWHAGLMVRDKRYIMRIANIDLNALEESEENRRKLFRLMLRTKNEIRQAGEGRMVYYMSKDLYTPIELAAIEKGNLALSYEHIQGDVTVTRFAGYEISKNEIMDFDEDRLV